MKKYQKNKNVLFFWVILMLIYWIIMITIQPMNFLDSLTLNSLFSWILYPTRLTCHLRTIIIKIFTYVMFPESLSDNQTATISDHLPQFLIVPNILTNPPSSKSNIYKRDWSNFDKENFIIFPLIAMKYWKLKNKTFTSLLRFF